MYNKILTKLSLISYLNSNQTASSNTLPTDTLNDIDSNCNQNLESTSANTTNKSNINDSNSRVKCMPSARTINCQHHCVAILATRLFAILCNEQPFQQKLMNENQEVCFDLIVDILYPNNDPVRFLKPTKPKAV